MPTAIGKVSKCFAIVNKTDLQPVSRPVVQVLYFEGWVHGANLEGQRDMPTYRQIGEETNYRCWTLEN